MNVMANKRMNVLVNIYERKNYKKNDKALSNDL